MKLRFYINSEGKKIYALKKEINNKKTGEAHYKFIRIRNAPRSDVKVVRKN